MKLIRKNQQGFSPAIIILVVLVIGVIGALGYVAYDRFIVNNVAEQSAVATDVDVVTESAPEEIVDTSDLDEAISSLDKITDSETTEDIDAIDAQLEEF